MEFIHDLIAAIGAVLNSIPQGLLAMSLGFAAFPTAFGYIVGSLGIYLTSSVVPISFQAESLAMIKNVSNDKNERVSIVLISGILVSIFSVLGISTHIVEYAGETIISAMMAGVGLMLLNLSLDIFKEDKLVGLVSIVSAVTTYLLTDSNLIYTIIISLLLGSVVANWTSNPEDGVKDIPSNKLIYKRPVINAKVIRGGLALTFLTIGTNIAYGSVTAGLAGVEYNLESLGIYTGLANIVSSLFGGAPLQTIISTTGSAPRPVFSAILLMIIMTVVLAFKLLPRIGKYLSGQSIAGFLFVLGVFITIPENASIAFSGESIENNIIAGVAMSITAISDPFIGLVSGILLKVLFSIGIGI